MNDQIAISVTIPSVSHKGKFFVLEPSFWGNGKVSGIEIANEKKLRLPGSFIVEPPNGDPGQYPEKPHLIHVPALGGMPRDFENLFGIWIVSEALKQLFESIDPKGFAFAACDFTLADGSPGPQHYLCEVVRSLDALDEDASRVKIKYERDHQTEEDLKFYSVSGGASLVFKEEVVGDAHIFRQFRLGTDAICDRVLADALNAANLDGVEIRDAADL
ncbi:hypothetical protein CFBP2533_01800 [Xanthomonas hortorum pv. pelargonii]|nr:hypothetical protein CFBP2533_01800 [Xanthomonas hortorum pv. pelargonii]CAD0299554.1 hypothetical protein CFBP2533_01800 [Xanthomonas hortorum pv. pelargonii]